MGAGDRWGPEGGAPSFPHPTSPPLMAGEPPPLLPLYLFIFLSSPFFFPPCWMQGLQHPSVAARLPPTPSILGKGGRGLLAAPQILPTGAGGPHPDTAPPGVQPVAPRCCRPSLPSLPCHLLWGWGQEGAERGCQARRWHLNKTCGMRCFSSPSCLRSAAGDRQPAGLKCLALGSEGDGVWLRRSILVFTTGEVPILHCCVCQKINKSAVRRCLQTTHLLFQTTHPQLSLLVEYYFLPSYVIGSL